MKSLATFLLATVAALVLPGCFQSETTIHLNKDGSGTLVEQTTLGQQMLDMMAGFGGGGEKADPIAGMYSAEKGKTRAAVLGEGVTFASGERVETASGKGGRMTYKFADINKLKLTFGDGMKNASPAGRAPQGEPEKPVNFRYADGTLVITPPEPSKQPAAEAEGPGPQDNPEAAEAMKQMLSDMKISVKLVVEPGIAETDATYRDGKAITLVEMNMGKLLEKPDTLKKLSALDRKNPTAAMEFFKGIEGAKMETKKEITVKVN